MFVVGQFIPIFYLMAYMYILYSSSEEEDNCVSQVFSFLMRLDSLFSEDLKELDGRERKDKTLKMILRMSSMLYNAPVIYNHSPLPRGIVGTLTFCPANPCYKPHSTGTNGKTSAI